MISLFKEKLTKWVGRVFLLLLALVILFASLILAGLEMTSKDNNMDSLRNVPIEYVKKMDNGGEILKVYKVPDSKIGPKDWRYVFKNVRDSLWISLSKTPKDKAEVYLLIADKKMFETVKLIKCNENEKLVSKSLDESIFNLKEAKKAISGENKKDIEISKMNQRINNAGLAYEDIVKSFNYKSEKMEKIVNDLENWNKGNN
jgi:hypothetical protein